MTPGLDKPLVWTMVFIAIGFVLLLLYGGGGHTGFDERCDHMRAAASC